MIKIQYVLYPLLLMIFVSLFVSLSFSQVVTNQSTVNSSIINGSIKNDSSVTVINAVGDIDCSNHLDNQVKKDNPDILIVLGDLCYNSDLRVFNATYGHFKKDNKLACLLGNHDSREDGSSKLLNKTREYCGDHWYRKIANDTTLLIGLNTNGDTKPQTKWGQSLVTNGTLMTGIKNVMLMVHKPAHTPPESHHAVRNSTIEMISSIENNISKSIEVYEIAAHNHLMAESSNGRWFISGGGGRSHHDATSSQEWPFVNTKNYGYLQIRINNTDGKVLNTNFYGLNGRLIH